MKTTVPTYAISVIIPLEEHRGFSRICVEAWTAGQTYPRQSYRIVIAAPTTSDRDDLRYIESLLSPQDQLLLLPFEHDMELIAKAAAIADGEALFFTEAHCIPASDAIEQSLEYLNQHPEWGGFSGRSIPITHNLLSGIEAEMYVEDIDRNMRNHDWLKVLDQCLVLRTEALKTAGGIEPEFGHFAEWVLAARLHEKGIEIGYASGVVVHHQYVGALGPLIDFTRDFARGEFRFASRGLSDSCTGLFLSPPIFEKRQLCRPRILRRELDLLFRSLVSQLTECKSGDRLYFLIRERVRLVIKKISTRGILGGKLSIAWITTQFWILSKNREAAKSSFLRLIQESVALGYDDALREYEKGVYLRGTSPDFPQAGKWLCGWPDTIGLSGFHEVEVLNNKLFQWCEPMATATIWLKAGSHRVMVRWNEARPLSPTDQLSVFCAGSPVDALDLRRGARSFEASIRVEHDHEVMLSWVCDPLEAPGDSRNLGLPVQEIEWSSRQSAAPGETIPTLDFDTAPDTAEAVYFLHVSKCAGTNLGIILDNAFDAETIAAPYLEHYYRREVADLEIPRRCHLARGHYGWTLPDSRTERDWKVFTMVRDPLDRLLSLYRYQSMHGRFRGKESFEEWIRNGLALKDTIASNFIPGPLDDSVQGIEAVSRYLAQFIDDAKQNLLSCSVIGLQEHFDDSIDLFSRTLGLFPPHQTTRINQTSVQIKGLEISSALRNDIERLLEPDYIIHSSATARFEEDWKKMRRDIDIEAGRKLDRKERRVYLRERFIDNRSGDPSGKDSITDWSANNIYCGTNLGRREISEGVCHRWSGPEETTLFHMQLPHSDTGTWSIQLRFHPATPDSHLAALELQVDDTAVHFEKPVIEGESLQLGGELRLSRKTRDKDSQRQFASFTMGNPVRQGENEFRKLGVALRSICIEARTRN